MCVPTRNFPGLAPQYPAPHDTHNPERIANVVALVTSKEGGGQDDQDGIRKGGGEHILVGTLSGSHYLIDLHAMRLTRLPASGDEVLTHDDGQPMSA